jgi:hypothetical protein
MASENSDRLFPDVNRYDSEQSHMFDASKYDVFKAGDVYVHYLILVADDMGIPRRDRSVLTWDWVVPATWRRKPDDI